ncbi:S-adenosyl-L-methionine-dependent methyltransferase [Xylaria palmicola]|nr:S-adenosyl-L-methionine-dependent methyltransferase [Xylaria palmicola]
MDSRAAVSSDNVKERLKASYDAMAPAYNEWTIPHSKLRMDYLQKALERLDLPSGAGEGEGRRPAFLELGCGCGLPVTQTLLSHHPGARIVANDLSDTQLALARENLIRGSEAEAVAARLELIPGDMNALTFPSGSLDLIVAFYSIIHLPRDEQTALLRRAAQWLRPGGCFVANFAKEESEAVVVDKWLDDDKGWMYWSAWGEEKTLQQMKEAGFDVVVADVVEDVVDATFLWVVAKR